MRSLTRFALVALALILAAPAVAQLTQEDIDALRERGKKEGWTFEVGLCHANSTYSLEQLCGLKRPPGYADIAPPEYFAVTANLPPAFDWRDSGAVTSVKAQGECGSCWAFATVGAFEHALKTKRHQTLNLSEQYLVSCNTDGYSCDGGYFAHDYHSWKPGICGDSGSMLETDFPYTAQDDPCDHQCDHNYWIRGWNFVDVMAPMPETDDIKWAILTFGSVATGVYVGDEFLAYAGGVFNLCAYAFLNHAVILVGWDDNYEGQGVWILKNSWGVGWGEEGYMYIPYECSGVGMDANYVYLYPPSTESVPTLTGWGLAALALLLALSTIFTTYRLRKRRTAGLA